MDDFLLGSSLLVAASVFGGIVYLAGRVDWKWMLLKPKKSQTSPPLDNDEGTGAF